VNNTAFDPGAVYTVDWFFDKVLQRMDAAKGNFFEWWISRLEWAFNAGN
jgi:hypothetical protein